MALSAAGAEAGAGRTVHDSMAVLPSCLMSARLHVLVAALLPLPALALQWLLWPWLAPFVWFMFYPAVFMAARLGGRRGAWLAMLLAITLA